MWDVDAVIRDAERMTRAWFDVHVPEMYATLTPEDLFAIRKRIVEEQPALAHNLSFLREETFARAIAAVGRADAEARRLAAEAFQLFLAERHKVSYFDDALDILERLARRHSLGALTNGNADIARLGLDRYFRFAFWPRMSAPQNRRRRCSTPRSRTRTFDARTDGAHRRQPDRRHSRRACGRHRNDLGAI